MSRHTPIDRTTIFVVVGGCLGLLAFIAIAASVGIRNARSRAQEDAKQPESRPAARPRPDDSRPNLVNIPPEQLQRWKPSPGEMCNAVGEKVTYTDNRTAVVIATDVFAHQRLVKYLNANDSQGMADLLGEKRIIRYYKSSVSVKVLEVHRSGLVEVRIQEGEGQGQEAVVAVDNLREK